MHETHEPTLNELEGPLRRAVEQVRAEPLSQKLMEQALEYARRLPMQTMRSRWSQYNVAFAGLVGLAATVLIAVIFGPAAKNGQLASQMEEQWRSVLAVRSEGGSKANINDLFDEVARPNPHTSEDQVIIIGNTATKENVTRRQIPSQTDLLHEPEGLQAALLKRPSKETLAERTRQMQLNPASGEGLGRGIPNGGMSTQAEDHARMRGYDFARPIRGNESRPSSPMRDSRIAKNPSSSSRQDSKEQKDLDGGTFTPQIIRGGMIHKGGNPANAEGLPELGGLIISGSNPHDVEAVQRIIEHYKSLGSGGKLDAKEAKELEAALKKKMGDKAPSQLSITLPGLRGPSSTNGTRGDEQERAAESLANNASKTVRVISLKGIDPAVVQQAIEAIQGRQSNLAGKAGGTSDASSKEEKGKEELATPQTWTRDGRPPTFARVYLGNGNSLDLVSLQVTVTVEGPRARTVVDHIFHNPHSQQLEGTFEYPLPTGASPSYFAMFLGQTRDTMPPRFARRSDNTPLPQDALAKLTPDQMVKQVSAADWGTLQEARVVSKQKALETYEDVVRGRIDPALLEYAGGNTFSGRVFPIPPKGYNRVILAYEELLPVFGGKVAYRFPMPNRPLKEMLFTLQANAAECKAPLFFPKDAKREEGGSFLSYARTWTNATSDAQVVFAFTPAHPELQAISGRQGENGPQYVYARLRPELAKVQSETAFAGQAVFLLDTSLSEHPDRFAVNMRLLRKILESDPDIKQFNILTFNVAPAWVEPKGWLANTKQGREQAFARLDGMVLEGATDLSAALEKLAKPGFEMARGTPLNVFLLSDGQITWGEPDVNVLMARFEKSCPFTPRVYCYRTGLGAENLELFEALTRRGGNIFNCFTEADLPAVAQAHRRQCLQVESVRFVGGPQASDVLIAGRQAAIYPGGELIVAAKMQGTGKTAVLLEGTFQGKKYAQEYPLDITGSAELAPRGWAEIAVSSLLALNDPKLDSLVVAYCQEFGIASRVASFLVLENAADYKRFNLEQERGKTVNGDLGQYLEELWTSLGHAVKPREAFARFLNQLGARVQGTDVLKLLALLPDNAFELPATNIAGAILHKGDVPPRYLAERDQDIGNANLYLAESRRRAEANDASGAIRALSSVVEIYPGRSDALRLVGYRLLDLQQPVQAARLFQRVQQSRPFEPHSYRDLARSLEAAGNYGLAALQYEIILAGTWHNRFGDSLKNVALEEYALMMREAINKRAVSKELANHFGERLEQINPARLQSDLRVTISWNTDATDVDLWVLEPDGVKCFYQNQHTPSGGELSQDQTQGYGPERYQIKQAKKGLYKVMVHYYRGNPNLLAGETHVNVVVTRKSGTPRETVERHTVILKKQDEAVEVCRVAF